MPLGIQDLDAIAAGGGQGEACSFVIQEDHPVAAGGTVEVAQGGAVLGAVGERVACQIDGRARVVDLNVIPVLVIVIFNNRAVFGANLADDQRSTSRVADFLQLLIAVCDQGGGAKKQQYCREDAQKS